ncbi:MAG: Fe-S cluster assembly protein SufD [Salibacteraceae bacterium]
MDTITKATQSQKEKFLSQFKENCCIDTNRDLQNIRDAAQAALEKLNFPTTRDEYWKYTRIAPILRGTYHQMPGSEPVDLGPTLIENMDSYDLVFVNGYFSPEHSSRLESESWLVLPLSEARNNYPELITKHYGQYADYEKHAFTALNTAYCQEGACILLKDNAQLDKPVRIINLTQGDAIAYHPRNLLVFGKGSKGAVLLSYETGSGTHAFTNAVSEIVVQENAHAELFLMQHKSDTNSHIETTQVFQEKNSQFQATTITLKGKIVRNNLNVVVDGENCLTRINGIYLTRGKQHVDNHTMIDHRQPHCESHELYKGIMNESSTGVFNGKVFVRQYAQKTNAFQSNQNILLTDQATINSKPELEIYADDVKCSHGSTTGQFDEEAVFYLRSRGIGEASARKLMINAFAADVLEYISIEPLRDRIEAYIEERYETVL